MVLFATAILVAWKEGGMGRESKYQNKLFTSGKRISVNSENFKRLVLSPKKINFSNFSVLFVC